MSHAPQEEFLDLVRSNTRQKLFDFETDQERLFDQLATQASESSANLS